MLNVIWFLVAGVWLAGRAGRSDRIRASMVLWGGWLLGNGLVFSYMQGLAHSYYSVAIAPPIAALIAVAGREAWRRRGSWAARGVLAAMVAASGAWGYVLLNRVPTWYPEIRYTMVGLCALAVISPVSAGGGARAPGGAKRSGGVALPRAVRARGLSRGGCPGWRGRIGGVRGRYRCLLTHRAGSDLGSGANHEHVHWLHAERDADRDDAQWVNVQRVNVQRVNRQRVNRQWRHG